MERGQLFYAPIFYILTFIFKHINHILYEAHHFLLFDIVNSPKSWLLQRIARNPAPAPIALESASWYEFLVSATEDWASRVGSGFTRPRHFQILKCLNRWREAPTVICLHDWDGFLLPRRIRSHSGPHFVHEEPGYEVLRQSSACSKAASSSTELPLLFKFVLPEDFNNSQAGAKHLCMYICSEKSSRSSDTQPIFR